MHTANIIVFVNKQNYIFVKKKIYICSMKKLTVTQYAKKIKQTRQNVLYHLNLGHSLDKVKKAYKVGNSWILEMK
jgi:hypothetical protein